MIELTVPAALEELEHVQEFVEQALEEQGISMKIQMQISIAVEEIYVNIARYAYHPEIGQATVRCAVGPVQDDDFFTINLDMYFFSHKRIRYGIMNIFHADS